LNNHLRCLWLSKNEDSSLVAAQHELDVTEFQAAAPVGVEFLPISGVLEGHELCTRDSWVNSLVLNARPISYRGHPSLQGQQAIERAVYAYLTRGP
jgi:hypothetical protein